MSDVLKALLSPQFNWYNKCISLGSNGLPYQAIKVGLKQPNLIKISFTVNGKEMNGSIPPNQTHSAPSSSSCKHCLTSKQRLLCTFPQTSSKTGPCCFRSWKIDFKRLVYPNGRILSLCAVPKKTTRCIQTSLSASLTISKHSQAFQYLVTSWFIGFAWQGNLRSCRCMIT